MRILLVGVTEIAHSTTVGIKAAFEALGYEVDPFNYREIAGEYSLSPAMKQLNKATHLLRRLPVPLALKKLHLHYPQRKKMGQALLTQAQAQNYDLIFLAKVDTLDWTVLAQLSQHTPTWYFFMDGPSVAKGMLAAKYAKAASIASATFQQVYLQFKAQNPNSHWVIEGESTRFFYPPAQKIEKSIDVLFVGEPDAKRSQLIRHLINAGISVDWHGPGAPKAPLYLNELTSTYHKAKIVLHINRKGDGFSNRVIQVLFSGAFLLSEFSNDLDRRFRIDTQLCTFHSADDCVKKIRYYLEKPDTREQIAEAGHDYATKTYSWEQTLSPVLDQLNKTGL